MDSESRWGFKAHIYAHVLDNQRVLLLTETGEKKLLNGRLFAQITPLLSGHRTMDEIVDALRGVSSPERTYYALFTLERGGYIARLDDRLPQDQPAFWHSLNADPSRSEKRMRDLSIRVMPIDGTADVRASVKIGHVAPRERRDVAG